MKEVTTREFVATLEAHGFTLVRESKHKVYSNGTHTFTIPHSKGVSPGVQRDFFKLVKRLAAERKAA